MPELPEVETTTKGLRDNVVGLTIRGVWTDWDRLIRSPKLSSGTKEITFRKFKNRVVGRTITGARRRGKNIIIELDDGQFMRVHLKMTGHFLFGEYRESFKDGKTVWVPIDEKGPLNDPFNRFIHVMFTLRDKNHRDWHLAFCDMRKFGRIELLAEGELEKHEDINALGPEILEGLSLDQFKERLQTKSRGKIKSVLMDQAVVAGIGNIYSDEILWASDVHPLTLVKDIPEERFNDIFENSKALLASGIDMGGDSDSDYRNINGEKGEFQGTHQAYRKTDEKCQKPGCNGIIERLVIGGRSSHFCAKHQINHSNQATSGLDKETTDPKVLPHATSGVTQSFMGPKLIRIVAIVLIIILTGVIIGGRKESPINNEPADNAFTTATITDDEVSFSKDHYALSADPKTEYITIEIKPESGKHFDVSKWQLKSLTSQSNVSLPSAVPVFRQGEINVGCTATYH